MTRLLRSQSNIVVVDPRPSDYQNLALFASRRAWQLHFLTNGCTAIRFARPAEVDLWMINVCLPDMSGLDLLESLRDRIDGARIIIVAERYQPDDERRACLRGAALYLCKDQERSIDCTPLLVTLSDNVLANASSTGGVEGTPFDRERLIDKVFH